VERIPPASVCAALRPHLTDARAERIEQVLAHRLAGLTAVVENLHDPHNGAAAIRSIEAVGLQDFHAITAREPFSAQGGITLRADQWIDLHEHPSTQAAYAHLRQAGFAVWAAAPGGHTPLEQIPVSQPLALVFGNERDGLTDEALESADGRFFIPMQGFTGSFNLSVSAALSVYVTAARFRAALGAPGDLPADRVERLRALWYCLSVRAAGWILDRWRP
jgi:tRNA (guanosine-2'-O-)-methyltransferase